MEGTLKCHFGFTFKLLGVQHTDLFWQSQFNKRKRTSFALGFKTRVELSAVMKFFESRNSTKMKMTFTRHLGFEFTTKVCCLFYSHFLKVSIQWKWKGLSAVILALVSQQKLNVSFNVLFWKSQFKENEKDFQVLTIVLALVSQLKSTCPF
jgi:hypothetical protein